jgi:hypothetical protein
VHFSQRTLSPHHQPTTVPAEFQTYVIVRDTFDICAGAEEATFAREHREDGVWVVVEGAQPRNDVLD